jgi:hypothetical protein
MDLSRHPLHFIDFLRKHPDADRMELRFVTYTYVDERPAASFDRVQVAEAQSYVKNADGGCDRDYFEVKLSAVNETWLERTLAALPKDETLGFTGRVFIDGEEFFMPALDLAMRGANGATLDTFLAHFDWDDDDTDAALYVTDNSFHVYFAKLLPAVSFQSFVAKALLLNDRDGGVLIEAVDTRWVGHAILRNAATVRWSLKHTNPRSVLPFLSGDATPPSWLKVTKAPSRTWAAPPRVEDDLSF